MEEALLTSEFYRRYRGAFYGILKWAELDDLWQSLKSKASADWYIYAIGDEPPQQTVSAGQFSHFIDEINILLRKDHQEDYCGIVYVDDKSDPAFIKIYDPNNLGVACGYSDNPPLPGWVLSLIKPEILDKTTFMTQSRKRWWQRLFA